MKIEQPGKYEQNNGRFAEVREVNERFAIGWDSDREGAVWDLDGRRVGNPDWAVTWNLIGPWPRPTATKMVRFLVWDRTGTTRVVVDNEMVSFPGRSVGAFCWLSDALAQCAGKPHFDVIRVELNEHGASAEHYKVPG